MEQKIIDRTTIKGIRQNFFPYPLKNNELDEKNGFYVDTMLARTGNPAKLPIEDIFCDCTTGSYNFIHLLLGHRGCGKSTEINRLEIKFRDAGFAVKKIDCQAETNFASVRVEDILILISNALLEICDEKSILINKSDIETLRYFFAEKEEKTTDKDCETKGGGIGGGISINTPIVKLSADAKAQIMNTSEKITTIRENVINHFSEWNRCIDNIIEKIKEKDNRKYPIIIFENFDKIVPVENAIKIFEKGYLEKIRTYIIYTFPISLSYSEKFGTIEQYASSHFFPMIDVKTKEGKKNETGYNTIEKIIEKRAELTLFEDNVIDVLIEKTGGSLRDVFKCIELALRYTDRNGKDKVGMEELNMALNEVKSILSRRIEKGEEGKDDYYALKKIHEAKIKTIIEDKSKMLGFLEAHVVLEYNGERWHDLHPLIYDFLKDKW